MVAYVVVPADDFLPELAWYVHAGDGATRRHDRGLSDDERRACAALQRARHRGSIGWRQHYGALEWYFRTTDPEVTRVDHEYAASCARRASVPWRFTGGTLALVCAAAAAWHPAALLPAAAAVAVQCYHADDATSAWFYAAFAAAALVLGPAGVRFVVVSLVGGTLLWYTTACAASPGAQYARQRAWFCMLPGDAAAAAAAATACQHNSAPTPTRAAHTSPTHHTSSE